MESSEDFIKRKQNVLISDHHGDSLEKPDNVQIKSEPEECMFESNYAEDSLPDSYCSDVIKIEEQHLQCETDSPFPIISKQEIKTEIKKELDDDNLGVNHGCESRFKSTNTKELDSEKDVKLQIGASTEIHHEQHCRSTKRSKLLSNIGKQSLHQKEVKTKSERTLVTHTGGRRYKCEICSKQFKREKR
uniref:Uncharacterized protein LOC114343660 isoform X2 n=1 Tax=Diabrotica virgifera virgifera TaxID=50390 RepID=A0A6P7GK59_DIAVI